MVRISEWLSEGWALVKDDIMTFAVAALLAGLIGTLTAGICMAPLMVGLYMMAFAKMKGEPVAIGDVFNGFQKFGPAFVAYLIIAIPTAVISLIPGVGQIVAPLVYIAIGAVAFYTMQLIAVSDISPVEAIQQSFEKTKDNFLMYCVAALAFSVVGSIGVIACIVGQFVTISVVVMAGALAYRDNFGMPGGAAQPDFVAPAAPVAPAPPTAMPTPEPPKPEPPTQ